jgi:hypothetical protein
MVRPELALMPLIAAQIKAHKSKPATVCVSLFV